MMMTYTVCTGKLTSKHGEYRKMDDLSKKITDRLDKYVSTSELNRILREEIDPEIVIERVL